MNMIGDGASGPVVIGLGEALFDCFEDRSLLGGAPVNFTVHAHQLLTRRGGRGVLVSRIGADPLGKNLLAEVEHRGIETGFLQTDPVHPTGRVDVLVSQDGQPTYRIAEEVAWDFLEFTESLKSLAPKCTAVCFGTLAQRSRVSRETIQRFLEEAVHATKLFDVNLRQNYYDEDLLRESFTAATAVKLNEEELTIVGDLLGTIDSGQRSQDQTAEQLMDEFQLEFLALTRGSEGTGLYQGGERAEGTPVRAEARPDADSVGAGDACCAGIMVGMLSKWPLQETADLANRLGAFVASQPGGTPKLPDELLDLAAAKDGRKGEA